MPAVVVVVGVAVAAVVAVVAFAFPRVASLLFATRGS